jgi:malate dehydrogenase (quinone)
MLEVIARCFDSRLATPAWQEKLKAMIPSHGGSLIEDAALLHRVRERTLTLLDLA